MIRPSSPNRERLYQRAGRSGVGATVKHFPGLGRVRTDTHHFSAKLDTPLDELEASDWIPFRKVLSGSKAQLMIGHVTLDRLTRIVRPRIPNG